MPPMNRPTMAPKPISVAARRTATPMISRVPQAGHFGVPSFNGREQVGQLKTCASASPIASFGGPSDRWPGSRPRRRLKAIPPSVGAGRADAPDPMVPRPAGTFGRSERAGRRHARPW